MLQNVEWNSFASSPMTSSSKSFSDILVRKEIERCYELIHRLGRGVVYLGSSRMGPDHSHYLQVLELGREIANLLECPSWMGAGPGLMDAATKGALQAGKSVGGFKIGKEAGEWTASNSHPYLPSEVYLTCSELLDQEEELTNGFHGFHFLCIKSRLSS